MSKAFTYDYKNNKIITFKFDYEEVTNATSFAIIARNDVTGTQSVYPLAPYIIINQSAVNTAIIVCGSILGAISLVLIILGIIKLIKLKNKENRVYERLEDDA